MIFQLPKKNCMLLLKSKNRLKRNQIYKSVIQLSYIQIQDSIIHSNDKLIVYFEKDDKLNELNYGDEIIFMSNINKVRTQGNPNEFDYHRFLLRNGISGQSYLRSESWKRTGLNHGNKIFNLAYGIRDYLADIYKQNNISDKDLSVLQALTLGDKSELDKETKHSYSVSGAMHILAVSGLHVGILYVLFNAFLVFLNVFKYKQFEYGKWIKAFIIIILLWSFAILSGLSPSVRRAALMFSFIVIGTTIKQRTDIYNSLAASAFVLLLIDPYQITQVGFQLSYCAVISIVYFQPKIVGLFVIKNKIVYYIWSLTAVSIAAQIGTFPFSLYYFNIFPNYFFLTNIFVIPLATVIIYLAVLLLIFSAIPIMGDVFSFLLKYSVKSLNYSVEFVEQRPYSFTDSIPFNSHDVLFAYLLIVSAAVYVYYKNYRSLRFSLYILLSWIGINTFIKYSNSTNSEFIVYNIKGESAVNIVEARNLLISDSSILEGEKIRYAPMNRWLHIGCRDYEYIHNSDSFSYGNILKTNNLIVYNDKTILLLSDRNQLRYHPKKKIDFNYIILSANASITIEEIESCYQPGIIIFDSSNNYYTVENWIEECNQAGITFHSVIHKGAYSVEI